MRDALIGASPRYIHIYVHLAKTRGKMGSSEARFKRERVGLRNDTVLLSGFVVLSTYYLFVCN